MYGTLTCSKRLQVEAFSQFFIGSFNTDMSYVDDFYCIVKRNLQSVSGFWFDLVTSIPWAYVDLGFFLVICPARRRVCTASPPDSVLVVLHCAQDCKWDVSGAVTVTTTGNERVIRIVKVLRILRIAKVLKLVKLVT